MNSIPTNGVSLAGKLIKDGSIAVVGVYLAYQLGAQIPLMRDQLLSISTGQNEVYKEVKLGNHFNWAKCVNDANQITDEIERKDAINRCIPPPEKTEDTAYKAIGPEGEEEAFLFNKVNAREAEKIADSQDATHRKAIENAVTISPHF